MLVSDSTVLMRCNAILSLANIRHHNVSPSEEGVLKAVDGIDTVVVVLRLSTGSGHPTRDEKWVLRSAEKRNSLRDD